MFCLPLPSGIPHIPPTPLFSFGLSLALFLFALGLFSFLQLHLLGHNLILILISLELILLALGLLLVSLSFQFDDLLGSSLTLFLLPLAGAESALALALLIAFYPLRGSLRLI